MTAIYGELQQHQAILERVRQARQGHHYDLVVVLPTLSLLQTLQNELLEQPDLDGSGGVRFLLFNGFVVELADWLGLVLKQPSPVEQELILSEVFHSLQQQGKLPYLSQVPLNASYRRALNQGIQEWQQSRLTPECFSNWAQGQGPRQQELARLYQDYTKLFRQRGFYGPVELLADLLQLKTADTSTFLPRWRILLYGFNDLNPWQRELISVLEKWFDWEALVDPTRVPEFQELTRRNFPFSDNSISASNLDTTALSRLQADFWVTDPAPPLPRDDSIQLLQVSGAVRQAVSLARQIKRIRQQEPSYDWGDFLVITPQPQQFLKLAGPIWREYQLPLPETAGVVIATQLVSYYLQLLAAVASDWSWPALESLIRFTYQGNQTGQGDRLRVWLLANYGAVSGASRWLELTEQLAGDQAFKELGIALEPWQQSLKLLQMIPLQASFQDYLRLSQTWFTNQKLKIGSLGALVKELIGPLAAEGQAQQVVLENLAQAIAYCDQTDFGRAQYQLGEYLIWIRELLTGLDLPAPPLRESTIRVVSPREACGLRAAVVWITGLEQGNFPRIELNDWKLTPADRAQLLQEGVELETGTNFQLQERLAFYWGLQAARQRLYLVYQDQNQEGQPQNRASFLELVLARQPELARRAPVDSLAPDLPASLEECAAVVDSRQRWSMLLALDPTQLDPKERLDCDQLWKQQPFRHLAEQIQEWQRQTPGSRTYTSNTSDLAPILTARLGETYHFAITALEDYRVCPYRFFLKHLLQLRPLPRPVLLPEVLELGRLYHQVLQEFGTQLQNQSLRVSDTEQYRQVLKAACQRQLRIWEERVPNDLTRLALAIQTSLIELRLERWLQTELEWTSRTGSRFKWYAVEFNYGKAGAGETTVTEPYQIEYRGIRAKIWGRIDRIDADQAGNFTVYDYKTGRGPTVRELLDLKQLQLPVYLMALEQLVFGPGKAVGGSYLGLRQPSRSQGGIWQGERLGLDWKASGQLTAAAWQDWLDRAAAEVIAAVQGIRQGQFGLGSGDCPDYCEYRSGCRGRGKGVEQADAAVVESGAE